MTVVGVWLSVLRGTGGVCFLVDISDEIPP